MPIDLKSVGIFFELLKSGLKMIMKVVFFFLAMFVGTVLLSQNKARALQFFESLKSLECYQEDSYLVFVADTVIVIDSSNAERRPVSGPVLPHSFVEEGKIALDVYVDANGKVNHVRFKESQSTSGSTYLIKLAMMAAKTIRYETKPGTGIEHIGFLIFDFKKI